MPPSELNRRCLPLPFLQRMVGECPRCENNFCGAHRLPEDHACPALSMFKRAAFEENRQKLAKEATIASKISAF